MDKEAKIEVRCTQEQKDELRVILDAEGSDFSTFFREQATFYVQANPVFIKRKIDAHKQRIVFLEARLNSVHHEHADGFERAYTEIFMSLKNRPDAKMSDKGILSNISSTENAQIIMELCAMTPDDFLLACNEKYQGAVRP